MGLGNGNSKTGDKGSNYSYELKSLQGLAQLIALLGTLDAIKLDTAKLQLGGGSTVTAVVSSATNQTLQAINVNRKSVKIYNDSDVDLLVKEGTVASATSFTWRILPGEHVVIDDYYGLIDGISVSTPTGNIMVTETTY